MLEAMGNVVCLLDNQGKIVHLNLASKNGQADLPTSAQPATVHQILHPDCASPACDLKAIWSEVWSTVLKDGAFSGEFFDSRLEVYYEICVQTFFPNGGSVHQHETGCFAVVTVRDISARKQQEELLRQGKQRYRRLVEAISDYVYTVTVEQGRVVATQHSPRCMAVTGYSVEEFEENPDLWFDMVYDEDRPDVLEFNRKILAGQPVTTLEHRIVHKDGSMRWISNTPVVRCDDRGKLIAYEGVVTDITPRKDATQTRERLAGHLQRELLDRTQAERRARELTRKLFMLQYASAALTSSLDLAFVLETVTRNMSDLLAVESCIIFEWNHAAGTILELSKFAPAGWFEKKAGPKIIDLADFPLAGQALALRQAKAFVPGRDDVDLTGVPIWPKVEVNSLLLLPMEFREKVTGLVLMLGSQARRPVNRDDLALLQLMANQAASAIENARLYQALEHQLEETRLIESALRQSETRYRVLLNAIPDLIFRFNRKGEFLDYSTGEDGGLFVQPEEFMGNTIAAVLPPDVAEMAHQTIEEVIETGTLKTIEYQLPTPVGFQEYEARITRCCEDEAIVIIRNITERKQVERQIIHAERLAALGRLAASLAHEMNNPLQAIQSNLDLILDYPLSADQERKHLHIIRYEVSRLAHTLKHVLDFARPRAVPTQPVEVTSVIEQLLELVTKELQNKKIELKTDIRPVDRVLAIPQHLGHVFLNLILNAVEAMPSGGKLEIGVKTENDQVVVSVANNGPSIPADIIDKIFDPFFSTKTDGNGLGLWVSYNLVERYGGELSVQNLNYDRGVVFSVRLPQLPLPP